MKVDAAQTVPNTEPPGGQRTAHIEAWVPPREDGGQHGASLRCREAGGPGAAQPCPQTGTPAGREGLTARLARAPPRSSPRASLCPRRSTHSTALVPAQPAPPAAENATSPAAAMLTATPPPRLPGRGEASSFGYEKRVCGRSRAWRGRCHGGHAHCPLGSPRPRTTSPRRGARRGVKGGGRAAGRRTAFPGLLSRQRDAHRPGSAPHPEPQGAGPALIPQDRLPKSPARCVRARPRGSEGREQPGLS